MQERYEAMDGQYYIKPVLMLLVLSSQLMFFGISLMQSGAAVLDLLFCFLTVLSLVAIMTALSDLDLFYAGHMTSNVGQEFLFLHLIFEHETK